MTLIYVLLVAHFLADFVFQSDWMALNKSHDWDALWIHIGTYMATIMGILIFTLPFPGYWPVNLFFGVNFIAHFVQDAITSRVSARLWQAQKRHWFFVNIGVDQLLHYVTLFATAQLWLHA